MRLTNRILTALLLVATAVGLFAVFGPVTGLYRTTTVLTGSMRPALPVGT